MNKVVRKTTYRCWPVIDFSLDVHANSEAEALTKMENLIEKTMDSFHAELENLGFLEGGGVFESVCTDEWATWEDEA